ncbi:unnamed protein product, partial [marine sediment metagenome]
MKAIPLVCIAVLLLSLASAGADIIITDPIEM